MSGILPTSEVEKRLFEKGLQYITTHGWARFSLQTLIEELGVAPDDLPLYLKTKKDFFSLVGKVLTEKCAQALSRKDLLEESPKNRLLEWLLLRFEYLEPYRGGVNHILNAAQKCPQLFTMQVSSALTQMQIFYTYAHLNAAGILGQLKVKGATAMYLWTLRWWASSPERGMDQLMAYLDEKLTWGEEKMARYA